MEIDLLRNVVVYPNPASDEIHLSSNIIGKPKVINIYNSFGQRSLILTINNNRIDVSNLMQGLYIIEIVYDSFLIREKVILK